MKQRVICTVKTDLKLDQADVQYVSAIKNDDVVSL